MTTILNQNYFINQSLSLGTTVILKYFSYVYNKLSAQNIVLSLVLKAGEEDLSTQDFQLDWRKIWCNVEMASKNPKPLYVDEWTKSLVHLCYLKTA